jgi:glycine cleavage system H protein
MTMINGCEIPEDLYYLLEKHVWAKLLDDGKLRVGMTTAAVHLAGGSFIAVTPKRKAVGKELAKGKSMAIVESSKFVGPVPAPVTGTLLQVNESVASDPSLVSDDPYGDGWIAEMEPSDWEGDKASLASGPDGIESYRAKLEADGVNCDS